MRDVLLDPGIVALLPPLRVLLRSLEGFRKAASVVINLLDNGADILVRGDADFAGPDRNKIIAFARAQNVPRFSNFKLASKVKATTNIPLYLL